MKTIGLEVCRLGFHQKKYHHLHGAIPIVQNFLKFELFGDLWGKSSRLDFKSVFDTDSRGKIF